MINNWFKPIPLKEINYNKLKNHHFGKKIMIHNNNIEPDLSKTKIALFGVGDDEANKVREVLYTTSFPFKKLVIADLGNARKSDTSFLVPILIELLESNIVPILIGQSVDIPLTQYFSYQKRKQLVNIVLVDERIEYLNPRNKDQTYLNKIIDSRKSHLFNLGVIGYQSHFTAPDIIRNFEKKNFELFRLGVARKNLEEMEPVIRDADMMSFNLSAIRNSESPGTKNSTPSGFFTEEACQICRYAGMSEKLTSISFFNYSLENDNKNQTAHVISQMIWYFIDGFFHRKNDYPASTDSLTEYIVESRKYSHQITFWKSEKTGRWWMQIPIKTKRKLQRHQLIPCSYNDYQLTTREELPNRLLNAFRRFG